ncbi:serine hydrolase domain-containing protein [Lentzea cavernae]|uniref:Serine hydrolase n=1 Tax=Lentzea cavernae TaxID=2020703 RepID=A0ABQ3MPT0_9PSEU|nr:serine hydrolase domain-containing protein [Lentzea cavernae]GHH56731.1 serine hydrolase [Lentzea cavernae]
MNLTAAALAIAVGMTGAGPGADQMREAVHRIVDEGHAPAAMMSVQRHNAERSYNAGATPANAHVRIGSNTKAFVAVVVLQLVAEGRIDLDGRLPDPKLGGVTVRQLLQHTSGLPEYTDGIGLDRPDQVRHRYLSPHDLLDAALAKPAQFPPGAGFRYTNTNYVALGLLVQKVTGRPIQEEVSTRVIKRLKLKDTYWPTQGDEGLRQPYARGVHLENESDPKSKVIDVTTMDPSWAWAAGQLISTPKDLAAFYRGLLAGNLLPSAQLAQMRTTVETGAPGTRYGLGLFSTELTCGVTMWGHNGGFHGYYSLGGATDTGRAAAVVQTALPGVLGDPAQAEARVREAQDRALC